MAILNICLNGKDGSELVQIPAGEFELGREHHDPQFRHRVYLSEYWIGRTCVTKRQYARFVRDTGHPPPEDEDWRQVAKLDKPVVGVTWDDAVAYARWAGLALQTDAQWEKAAIGPLRLIQRRETPEETAAINKRLTPPGGELSWLDGPITPYEEWLFNKAPWEWCADWYDEEYFQAELPRDPRGPATGTRRVFRRPGYSNAADFTGVYRGWGLPCLPSNCRSFRLVRNK
jgi:formylglycine-generating enzyme required for sulfatase activity